MGERGFCGDSIIWQKLLSHRSVMFGCCPHPMKNQIPNHQPRPVRIMSPRMCTAATYNPKPAKDQHPNQTSVNGRWSRAEQTCTCKFSQLRAAAPLSAMASLQISRKRAAEFVAARCACLLRNKVLIRTMFFAFVRGRRLLRISARSCNRN